MAFPPQAAPRLWHSDEPGAVSICEFVAAPRAVCRESSDGVRRCRVPLVMPFLPLKMANRRSPELRVGGPAHPSPSVILVFLRRIAHTSGESGEAFGSLTLQDHRLPPDGVVLPRIFQPRAGGAYVHQRASRTALSTLTAECASSNANRHRCCSCWCWAAGWRSTCAGHGDLAR